MKIYCVYDCKVEAFGTPFFFKTKGEAIRGFSEIANDIKTQIGKYPADFTLFEMGDYDEQKGKFNIYSAPISLATAIEFVKEAPIVSPHEDISRMAVVN
jgi:hypothetical protein